MITNLHGKIEKKTDQDNLSLNIQIYTLMDMRVINQTDCEFSHETLYDKK